MEVEIDAIIDSVFRQDPLVTSVIVTDDTGLCLASKGSISEEAAGIVASIATRSDVAMPSPQQLQNQDASRKITPVVQIEAEATTIIIRRIGNIVVGIFKQSA
ncbi:hypothetical protein GGI07_000176 [Coemansia sp. Benny D115]|nr:hypothetical protein GGI07_000176 [Coemansia sp. Benny D115]